VRKQVMSSAKRDIAMAIKKKIPRATVEVIDFGSRFKLVVNQEDSDFRGFAYFTFSHGAALDSILMEYKLRERN
jgi:hypothetical protein